MFGIPLPWLILGLILSLSGTYGLGHHYGYTQKEAEDEALIVKKNQEMNDAKDKADADLYKAKQALQTKGKQLTDAIRSGQQRLYVPIASSPQCAASATGDGQARAELDKSVGEALVRIAIDGDKAIVQLNSCIDRYQSVREEASGNK